LILDPEPSPFRFKSKRTKKFVEQGLDAPMKESVNNVRVLADKLPTVLCLFNFRVASLWVAWRSARDSTRNGARSGTRS
jgi:hypothetical protein